ncbi:iron-binding protein [Sulfurimonas sp. HSL-3221]|uniref:iron-binding protein n=1 Tax=Thiomicrolovo sulfuroxydans TaxID=2894755 RepID=UPI001E51A897|nr:iron-binding protein [Sulfurimonas sp. HSL-3221]UFS63504.1 iron-binding protein [Sulfurimonas sp. HSL-3221]
MTPDVFKHKHALWLNILFTSFMLEDDAVKSELYDHAQIAFRHMRWIARALAEKGTAYTYDRDVDLGQPANNSEALQALIGTVKATMAFYPDSALSARMITDDEYLIARLEALRCRPGADAPVTAFDRHRTLPGKSLDQPQTDALTLFLFEESYKEYELILIYAYMQNESGNLLERDIYQDLIDESQFHLKSFGNMMAQMGILALPRPLDERTYKINDLDAFIRNGIAEEENAKEQCRSLAEAVRDEELSAFFDFINFQESYHIELMKKLLAQVSPK